MKPNSNDRSNPLPNTPPENQQRAAQFLEAVRHAVTHDLANQLVVIQGVLRCFEADEANWLSPNGRDYLRRLRQVTQHAQDISGQLRELFRLHKNGEAGKTVRLDELLAEVRAMLKQLFPDYTIEYHGQLEVPTVIAPPDLLRQTLLYMARVLLASVKPGIYQLHYRSRPVRLGTVQVDMLLPPRPGALKSHATLTESSFAERLDVALARECAACAGGHLTIQVEADGGIAMLLTLSQKEVGGKKEG